MKETNKGPRPQFMEPAIFSPDRSYRYTLWRELPGQFELGARVRRDGFVQFVGLNPSTADETNNDPTIRRCIGFAQAWGFQGFCMTNAFAFRATLPPVMKSQEDPAGPENDFWLCRVAMEASLIVVAWGKDGRHNGRAVEVLNLFRSMGVIVHCLGVNEDSTPKHPLYLPKTTAPAILPGFHPFGQRSNLIPWVAS